MKARWLAGVGAVLAAVGLGWLLTGGETGPEPAPLRVLERRTIRPAGEALTPRGRVVPAPTRAPTPARPTGAARGAPQGGAGSTGREAEPTAAALMGGAQVVGRVLDARGAPIPGATLYLLAMPAERDILYGHEFGPESPFACVRGESDGLGRFRLRVVPGAYTLGADAAGFGRAHRPLALAAGAEQRVELVLQPGGGIAGQVTDAAGEPLPGAHVDAFGGWNVELGPNGAQSDATGAYRIGGLVPGEYFLVARAEGYVPAHRGRVQEESEGVDFALESAPRVRGRIVDAASGAGVAGASVEVRYPRDLESGWLRSNLCEAQTDVDGEAGVFVLRHVSPGALQLSVSAEGYATQVLDELRLVPGQQEELRVELDQGGQVEGRVLDPQGLPLEGALVVRFLARPGLLAFLTTASEQDLLDGLSEAEHTRSDAGGRFRLPLLAAGSQTLVAFKAGYASAQTTVEVRSGATGQAPDLVLEAAGRLEGRVQRADGGPVAGLLVVASGPGGVRTAPLDEAGEFALDGLGAGRYRLSVNRGHQPLAAAEVNLGEREWQRLVLEVAGGTRVEGQVLGPAGSSPGSVQLLAQGGGVGSHEARVGSDGSFVLEGVPPGSYAVGVDGTRVRDGVQVPEAPSFRLDLRLPGGSLRGRVVAAGSAEGIPEARALLWLSTPAAAEEGVTAGFVAAAQADAAGRFELNGLEARAYRLVVQAGGHAPLERSVELGAGATRDVGELALESGALLQGRVRDAGGQPVAGAQLFVTVPGTGALATATPVAAITDAEGGFEIASLAPVPLDLSAFRAGSAPASARVSPGTGGSVELVLGVPCGLELELRDGNGTALSEGELRIAHAEGKLLRSPLLANPLELRGRSDAAGRFLSSELPSGAYRVEFRRNGQPAGSATFELAPDAPALRLVVE